MEGERRQTVLKWVWAIAVTLAAFVFFTGQRSEVAATLENYNPSIILVSFILTITGKLALSENAFLAAQRFKLPIGRIEAYRLYSFSQLGKYLPGFVWQYVGRAVAYRASGASYRASSGAILVETVWVLAGAAAIGAFFAGISVANQLLQLDSVAPNPLLYLVAATIGTLVLFGLYSNRVRNEMRAFWGRVLPRPRVILLQLFVWTVLGLSFWLLLSPALTLVPMGYTIGLFAIGYIAGFFAFFAPAGLGVREGILALGLSMYVTFETALVAALVARLIYVVAEFVLAGGFVLIKRIPKTSAP